MPTTQPLSDSLPPSTHGRRLHSLKLFVKNHGTEDTDFFPNLTLNVGLHL